MSVEHDFLKVGKDKNGELDFGIRASVCDLTYEEMTKLRAMICAAIGTMEHMWRREQQRKGPMAPAAKIKEGDG